MKHDRRTDRLKIAFAMINCNRRDGSARAVNEVAERLATRGHDVHLYARKVEDLDLGKIKWHHIPGPDWPEVADFYSYHSLVNWRLRQHPYDIVHSVGCNTLRANVITIQNIQPAKMKILSQVGRAESVSLPRRLTRNLYLQVTSRAEHRSYTFKNGKSTPLFLPVSKGVERELREYYNIGAAPLQIVPNAADLSIFHPLDMDGRIRWREANGIATNDLLAIFTGGEWARKGLDLAIKGLGKAKVGRLKLFVAGDDPDRERYLALATECGVSGQVVFGGFRRDIAEAMGAADFCLFPSRYEAFSLATIEAAACGLPVIAAKINGTEDFIEAGVTGEFVEHDADHIATVLARLCAAPEQLKQMGQAAQLLVERKYTWDRVTDMTEDAYREYLSEKKRGATR
jgi:glycosyltransferase involved in cell wall biosynthesis